MLDLRAEVLPSFPAGQVLLDFFTGKRACIPSGFITLVDVRDVAAAHIAAYKNKAAAGR
jgi:hypothetical protein